VNQNAIGGSDDAESLRNIGGVDDESILPGSHHLNCFEMVSTLVISFQSSLAFNQFDR
jgi:hypothetical protein